MQFCSRNGQLKKDKSWERSLCGNGLPTLWFLWPRYAENLWFFTSMGKINSNIRRIVNRYISKGSYEYDKSTGRPKTSANQRNLDKVRRALVENPTKSNRILAQKVNIPLSSFVRIKKQLGYSSYVCQKSPKYIKNQEMRCKTGCHYQKVLVRKCIIMND